MSNFLVRMHSSNDDVSSKRVYNSFFVLQVLVMINGAQFFNRPLDFAVLVALLSIVTGLSAMNLKAQLDSIGAKKDVATEIVQQTSDNQSATEVLQSNKPS